LCRKCGGIEALKVNFEKTDKLKTELEKLRPLSPAELSRLRSEFTVENTYNSNAIEGNSLTLRETALILEHGITIGEKPLKDHLEAVGHKNAFDYIIELTKKTEKLSERVIKEIHALVLLNDRENSGVYRKVPVRVSGALHTPADPLFITEQMQKLLSDYERSDEHPIEAAAQFHLRFEGIHPFIDGNGRTGRLLLNFELMKNGYLPINIKYTDRREYYNTFDRYFETGENVLTDLVVKYENEALEEYIKRII
jgi:Fic family protein